ncbi:hypothetical protein JMJ35_006832 [Cladonia borealis]|uniref:Uncharacterized protein n=1 Tax=Cladonia borealis TaxID=184061 RepID=A0AA39QWC8_9LECA|nr:hypothetical protein JMJ35_006832 [Cladonia borealis]
MLSSTLALGLLFVLFVDTIARRSHEHPASSYVEQLRAVGPLGVHLNSSESKHAASDSIKSSSWPKDNVKRGLNGTAVRNISSVDALELALVDNSSDLVEASKSTLVVNETMDPTCYRRRRVAPIANPAHCTVAIFLLLSAGDPEEAVLWDVQETWTYLTCKIEIVPRSEYGEYFTRTHLAQEATIIKRDCVTFEHGYRGGYLTVGLHMNFDLTVWASTSSITVNETTSAYSHILDLPDPLETGLDSPL